MIGEEDLQSAVSAGIVSEATAAALREHVVQRRQQSNTDEEHFRLISGFNDVFVVTACLLILGAATGIGNAFGSWIGAASVCVASWLLTELFVRRRRMALPAVVLTIAFVGGAFFAVYSVKSEVPIYLLMASGCAVVAAGVYWLRFEVPITIALGAGAAILGCLSLLFLVFPASENMLVPLIFVAGVATFIYALWWDASDRGRTTRRSDIAFWLHLVAAPLLVHPLFDVLGVLDGATTPYQALMVGCVYCVIAVISLAIDRRALMISSLGYVLFAFSKLLKQTGFVDLSFAVTSLVIGSVLLLLSANWHTCRAVTLRYLPKQIRSRVA